MANVPPHARLSVISDAKNNYIFDASESFDTNTNGEIVRYTFICDDVIISSSTDYITQAIKVVTPGTHTIELEVEDRGGLTSKDSEEGNAKASFIIEAIPTATIFGALFADSNIDDDIKMAKLLGLGCLRWSESMKRFNGTSKNYEKVVAAGLVPLPNLNWDTQATQFIRPNEYDAYLAKILLWFKKYKGGVCSLENEPTVDVFWKTDSVQFYINQLRFIVPYFNAAGVMVACGAIHVPMILDVMNGRANSGNSLQVKQLIEAYKTIDMDYVNIHCNSGGASVPLDFITKSADYLRSELPGKVIMSNEFHLEPPAKAELMISFVKAFKDSNVKYAVCYSSHGGKNEPIHNTNGTLTSIGIAYRDAIK